MKLLVLRRLCRYNFRRDFRIIIGLSERHMILLLWTTPRSDEPVGVDNCLDLTIFHPNCYVVIGYFAILRGF